MKVLQATDLSNDITVIPGQVNIDDRPSGSDDECDRVRASPSNALVSARGMEGGGRPGAALQEVWDGDTLPGPDRLEEGGLGPDRRQPSPGPEIPELPPRRGPREGLRDAWLGLQFSLALCLVSLVGLSPFVVQWLPLRYALWAWAGQVPDMALRQPPLYWQRTDFIAEFFYVAPTEIPGFFYLPICFTVLLQLPWPRAVVVVGGQFVIWVAFRALEWFLAEYMGLARYLLFALPFLGWLVVLKLVAPRSSRITRSGQARGEGAGRGCGPQGMAG